MNDIDKKNTGSFYTCELVADYIANWAISSPETSVLEPSFGDGIFLDAAAKKFEQLGALTPTIVGVELQKAPYEQYCSSNKNIIGVCSDFMDYQPTLYPDCVIGNPPYVSLKNLNSIDRNKALELMGTYGLELQSCSSMWVPFIVHSTEILNQNGRLGFVLPYEITHVRYAFPVWEYLSSNYGKITICRIFTDFFPDVDVETVLLLAEEKGSSTTQVHYEIYNTMQDLQNGILASSSIFNINEIIGMEKPFERNLLSKTVLELFNKLHEENILEPMLDICKFKIGYVSGNKNYFHIAEKDIKEFGISRHSIKKSLVNAKQINLSSEAGIETSKISIHSNLFYPQVLGLGEKRYIEVGESLGVNNGYKCKVRKPWYLTPGLEIPDLILTVFGDVPKLLLNNGKYYVSNSLLSGFVRNTSAESVICRWYNSLTLLSIEITIHSLGGGTLVLIPGETDRLDLLSSFPQEKLEETYSVFSEYAKLHSAEELYMLGDKIVLQDIFGFSEVEIENLHLAIEELRRWRNPEKRRG